MSKNSRKTIKKVPTLITEEKDCQTDELLHCLNDISISDNNVPTTSTTCIQDLSKEQLISRLICSQALCKRIKALCAKERQLRKDEQQKFLSFFHEVKVALHDSRHSYNLVKQEIADSIVLFLNGREKLKNKMETYQKNCQLELGEMRDKIARNDVVVLKANLAVTTLQKEIEKTLKISDDTRKKIQKATTEKGFIEAQYKALVKKQNEKYVTAAECCPRCSATQKVLTEFTDSIKQLKSDVKRLENECHTVTSEKTTIEQEFKTLKKTHDKVVHERNVYKEGDRTLRDQLAKAKKALNDTTNSPNRNVKVLEMLNSPARVLENSPASTKETPPQQHHQLKAAVDHQYHKSPTPPDKTPIIDKSNAEPPPKKRTNGTSLSREEGEVSPEDEAVKSPPVVKLNNNEISRSSPPLKPGESRKRPLSPKPAKSKPAKSKQLDYVYVMNDRPSETSKPESLLKQEIRPPPGYDIRQQPRPRHQSPPYRFESPQHQRPHPSAQPPYYDEYNHHRPMQRPAHPPPYHQQAPPYHHQQRPQMPPNGYPSPGYPPSHQQQHPPQYQQHPLSTPGSYYCPAVNGAAPPWHVDSRPSHSQQYQRQQHQPPGESWTGWR